LHDSLGFPEKLYNTSVYTTRYTIKGDDSMKTRYLAGILFLLLLLVLSVPVTAECEVCSGTYIINATGSEGGTIDPSGQVEVAAYANQTFVMTPDPPELNCWGSGRFYVVWDYVVDGEVISLGPDNPSRNPVSYTFSDVESNHALHADFTYAIVDARPRATFESNTTGGPVPLTVNFTQDQVSNHTGVLWDFGDGASSTEENPVHAYTTPGMFDATFTIFCENLSYAGLPLEISVFEPPVANFTANTTSGLVPLIVQFNDTSTGTQPFNYTWDFGDGTPISHEQNPLHIFTEAGFNQVFLTISNPAGNDTKMETIDVIGPIGGNKGYYLIHCNVDGADVYFDDMFMGEIEDGILLAQVYTTASPFHTYTVAAHGYETFTAPITDYPGKDQTVDLYVELVPFNGFYVPLGDGWNLFSTPIALDAAHDTLPEIFTGPDAENISVALGWNGIWFIPNESYMIKPLNAVYIRVNGESIAAILPSSSVTAPPGRSLSAGLSLIGPAPAFTEGSFASMPLDQALISINQSPGGGIGYLMVMSPGLNQPGWVYARGGAIQDIDPYKGYWVVMENPNTLYGFSTTPVNI
jgi:PKD repeat protein